MSRRRTIPAWLAAPLTAATLLLPLPSWAHSGHTNRAAWDVCADQELGADCQWVDGREDQYIGTCRSISGQLMCVRNRPIQRASPAAHGHGDGHDHDHAHGSEQHAHDHDHGGAAPDAAMVGPGPLLSACAALMNALSGSMRQLGAQLGAHSPAP